MERLGHIRGLASGTDAERPAATNDHEITKRRCAAAAPEASGGDLDPSKRGVIGEGEHGYS
jgi:hypothetical protein